MRARIRTRMRQNQGFFRRIPGEVVEGAPHFGKEFVGHVPREAVADQDALDDKLFAVRGHRVGGNEPAALSQSICEIVESERRGCGVS